MMGPLYKFGWFGLVESLQIAGLIGFLFGFVLERAGFGNARKLTAIFYLRDFAVLKVMFTAIVVCILGLLYFSIFGWIDLGRIYVLPTYIWPQVVGGFILGIGFVMGGYCPTTSVVATVSGKLDAFIFVLGMVLGSFIFAELFPLLQGFYEAGYMGAVSLSDVLKINPGIVALLVSLMAVGSYWFVERVEERFGDKETLAGGSKRIKRSGAALLIFLGLILAIVNPDGIAAKKVPSPQVQPKMKVEGTEEIAPRGEAPSSSSFKIVEDEGC